MLWPVKGTIDIVVRTRCHFHSRNLLLQLQTSLLLSLELQSELGNGASNW